jgi:hypothetical protein
MTHFHLDRVKTLNWVEIISSNLICKSNVFIFFFFFDMSTQEGGEGFELVTFAS